MSSGKNIHQGVYVAEINGANTVGLNPLVLEKYSNKIKYLKFNYNSKTHSQNWIIYSKNKKFCFKKN